jgi:peptidoglycan/xylan/chitin deacetylase (PgdA/CDA1 family)
VTSRPRSHREPDRSTADAVAVLAFHAVQDGPAPLCFPTERFVDLVDRLRRRGTVALTAAGAAALIARNDRFPAPVVVFTFDDAYASVHELAFPILADAGYVATVFAVADRLGGTNDWDRPGSTGHGLATMTSHQLIDLHASGWEVGNHSRTHRRLVTLCEADLSDEVAAGQRSLEDLLGSPVSSFAYPYGETSDLVRRVAAEHHDACFTIGASRAGRNSPLDAIERIEAWYLRHPWSIDHLDDAVGTAHLAVRRAARQARRLAASSSN